MNQIINVPYTKSTYCENSEIRSEDFIGELKEFEWLVYSYGSGSSEGINENVQTLLAALKEAGLS